MSLPTSSDVEELLVSDCAVSLNCLGSNTHPPSPGVMGGGAVTSDFVRHQATAPRCTYCDVYYLKYVTRRRIAIRHHGEKGVFFIAVWCGDERHTSRTALFQQVGKVTCSQAAVFHTEIHKTFVLFKV